MKKLLLIVGLLGIASQHINAMDGVPAEEFNVSGTWTNRNNGITYYTPDWRLKNQPGGHVSDLPKISFSLMFPKSETGGQPIEPFIVLDSNILEKIKSSTELSKIGKSKIEMSFLSGVLCNDDKRQKLFDQDVNQTDYYNYAMVLNTAIRHVANKDDNELKKLMNSLDYDQKVALYKIESTKVGSIFSTIIAAPGGFDYVYDVLSKVGRKIPLVKKASYNNRARILIIAGGGFMGLLAWLASSKGR